MRRLAPDTGLANSSPGGIFAAGDATWTSASAPLGPIEFDTFYSPPAPELQVRSGAFQFMFPSGNSGTAYTLLEASLTGAADSVATVSLGNFSLNPSIRRSPHRPS